MITRSVLKYIRISPRKFRLIIPLIKGKRAEEAIAILMAVKKGASVYGIELLKSAIANTKRMQGVEASDLYISKLTADPGPTLKRFRAASMGRASSIRKRTSHLTLELDLIKRPNVPAAAGEAHKKSRAVKESPAVKSPKIKEHSVKPKQKK